MRRAQAGARYWPYDVRRLFFPAVQPGRSEDEHLGVCGPVEQRAGGRLVGKLGGEPFWREVGAGEFGRGGQRRPGRGITLVLTRQPGPRGIRCAQPGVIVACADEVDGGAT